MPFFRNSKFIILLLVFCYSPAMRRITPRSHQLNLKTVLEMIEYPQLSLDVAPGFHFWQVHQSRQSQLCRHLWSTASFSSLGHKHTLHTHTHHTHRVSASVSPLQGEHPANNNHQFHSDKNRCSPFCALQLWSRECFQKKKKQQQYITKLTSMNCMCLIIYF